ncbi:MAG: HEAT repeat domain-containing protein [bacterium]
MGERLAAAKELARFHVRSAVAALTAVARYDAEPNLRAQAISSLAAINHESVFPAVLIGMADKSREVRASAARSLSHLSFDRADAYMRVMETTDAETLPDVARACIKAGIVAQGIERLASSDRRQAYEAFSLLSLLAKAKMTAPIVEAIANDLTLDIRLTAVRVLANTGSAEVLEQLQNLASKPGLCEELRTALLEALFKLEPTSAGNEVAATASMPTEEFSEEPSGEPNAMTAESSSEVAGQTHKE